METIEGLKKIIKEQDQLRLHSVSNSVAIEYAEFCVMCDRNKSPLLCLEDYVKHQCTISSVSAVVSSFSTANWKIYTPTDNPGVVIMEDYFGHKRTFDKIDFDNLMGAINGVHDY